MNKILLSLCFLLVSLSGAQATEDVQPGQLQKIEALQHRVENLTFDERDLNTYHLVKARTWLDLALSEYYDHDNSGAINAAIGQAETLLDALEKKQTGISMDTPLQIPGSEAVRPDLLDKLAALKKHQKFACGLRPTAQAEVYLVWTGHEQAESGWTHAESYARNVEDLIYAAQVAMDNCPEAAPVTPVVVAPPAAAHVMEKITLSGDALFAFDKTTLNPSALTRLDELAESIKAAGVLDEVILVGHTDYLRSDGHLERNQILSEQRAESIKKYLVGKGIPADKIHASGAGASQPIVQCPTNLSKVKQAACLQSNRRVEIILRGEK